MTVIVTTPGPEPEVGVAATVGYGPFQPPTAAPPVVTVQVVPGRAVTWKEPEMEPPEQPPTEPMLKIVGLTESIKTTEELKFADTD